jgi:hypothetical protein
MKRLSGRVLSSALCALLVWGLAACGGGSSGGAAPPAPVAVVAVADSFNLTAGTSGDVLANDTLGGVAASASTVVASATAALPAGISLNAGGVVSVSGSAVGGAYPIGYRICETAVPANCASSIVTVTVPVSVAGLVTGRAVDAATGVGVAGVTVSAGAASTSTDASGNFSLTGAPTGERVTVLFRSDAYAESARVAAVSASGSTDVQVRLLGVAATVAIDAAAGGSAGVAGSTALVVLPPASVQRADGSVPTGNMRVALTPINAAADSAVMPGDFTTLAAGVAAPIESFGALNVRLTDSAGAALNLRPGQSATVRIPLASRNAVVPASIPLFYFDNASGRWVQEGTATLVGSGAAAYYEGTVTHFSTWNADQVYNTVRVSGCLASAAGVPAALAQVISDGVDYTGTSSTLTDANGNFRVAIRKDSVATLTGVSGGKLTNTVRVGPYAADAALPACLALGQAGAGVTMKLTWGADPGDLDSHLFAPNGSHVYYGSKGSLLAEPFANLDVDDTSSYGPEVVTLTRLMVGTYKYSVYNYSGYNQGAITAAGARVELNIPGRTLELYVPPAGETDQTDWWNLFEFDVDASCGITVRRVGAFSSVSPATASSTPVYCAAP